MARYLALVICSVMLGGYLVQGTAQSYSAEPKYPHAQGKPQTTDLYLCNKSKPFMTIEYVSFRLDYIKHGRHEDIPQGSCVQTNHLGAKLVFLSVFQKSSKTADPQVVRFSGPVMSPDAFTESSIHELKVYQFDWVMCSPKNGLVESRYRAKTYIDSFVDMRFCFPDEVMRLFTNWITVPNVQQTLEF